MASTASKGVLSGIWKNLGEVLGAGGLPGWYEMTLKVFPGDCPPKNEHHHHHPLHLLTLEVGLGFEVWSGEIFLRTKEGNNQD